MENKAETKTKRPWKPERNEDPLFSEIDSVESVVSCVGDVSLPPDVVCGFSKRIL